MKIIYHRAAAVAAVVAASAVVTAAAVHAESAPATNAPSPTSAAKQDLMSITKCAKICARYDRRDGGVVDIDYGFSGPPDCKAVVTQRDGGRLAESMDSRKVGNVYHTTVRVGNKFRPGSTLCAKVTAVLGKHELGEVCFGLQKGPALPARPPAAQQHNPATWPCEQSSFCIYSDINGKGSHYSLKDGIYDLAGKTGLLDNHVYSVRNITRGTFCLYTDNAKGGDRITINRGEVKNLNPRDAVRISSAGAC